MSVIIYNENFNRRFESYEPYMRHVEDFDRLWRTKYEFSSDKGQKLTGYMYAAREEEPRGIIVMAHGFGGSYNSYMDCADYFAHNGCCVFAYDAAGTFRKRTYGTRLSERKLLETYVAELGL